MPARSRHCKRGVVAPGEFLPHTSLHPQGMWEDASHRCDPQVRTPGHWDVPYVSRRRGFAAMACKPARKTPEEGPMLVRLRIPVLVSLISLLFIAGVRA